MIRHFLALIAAGACVSPGLAEVRLPALFSKHAVLQKAVRVPVWGTASPGEKVRVTLDSAAAESTAGIDGKWQAVLDLSRSGQGPFNLVARGASNTVTVEDVMIGEVWLASGQSNMQWEVRQTTNANEEIAGSANPLIRQFVVKKVATAEPASDVKGEWRVASPANTGGFSAAGYFFSRALNRELGVPVGAINASWGATPIEAWMSPDGLAADADLLASTERKRKAEQDFPATLREFGQKFEAWSTRFERVDASAAEAGKMTATQPPPDIEWQAVQMPLSSPPAGAVWLRRMITIRPEAANLSQPLEIRPISGFFTVYFNGEKIAEATPATGARPAAPIYIPARLVRAGEAALTIRIFNPSGVPTIAAGPLKMRQDLDGEWQAWTEKALPAPDDKCRAAMPSFPSQPPQNEMIGGYLYNGMIAPLVPYAIRGVIWYQGETNIGRAWQYRTAFPLLIQDWRTRWGQGDFPFYYCQLANMGGKLATPVEAAWAELREAQSLALKLPHTGQAVLIDVGEAGDIHWRNKVVSGERLAGIALAQTYGRDIEFSGPMYRSHAVENGKIRIMFGHTGGGLKAAPLRSTYQPRSTADRTEPLVRNSPGSELEGFAVCGEDRKWVWAQAEIEGDTVLVWSPDVKEPVAARYAWAMNPTCNLTNGSGLPAAPFRTDDFPATTRNMKY